VLIAPHFFTEEMGIAEIARAKAAYQAGPLRAKLARLHADPDNAFHNWCDPWLDPDFRQLDLGDALAHIRVPILIVQGEDDQYGTVAQIEFAQQECYCPVEVALLPGTRHAPHREALEATLKAVAAFSNRLLRDHGEGVLASHAAQ
jgi:pimeloyl-ACP methyl ester carboxylesterase